MALVNKVEVLNTPPPALTTSLKIATQPPSVPRRLGALTRHELHSVPPPLLLLPHPVYFPPLQTEEGQHAEPSTKHVHFGSPVPCQLPFRRPGHIQWAACLLWSIHLEHEERSIKRRCDLGPIGKKKKKKTTHAASAISRTGPTGIYFFEESHSRTRVRLKKRKI